MNALILGMFFLLVGIYFGNILVIGFGAVFLVLGLYLNKSRPEKPQPITGKKTKHTVVMGEPPEQVIYPWEIGEIPLSQINVNTKMKHIDEKLDDLRAQEETEYIKKEIKELEKQKTGLANGLDRFNFLPLPKYGYSDPLERIFLGFPFRFWEKK